MNESHSQHLGIVCPKKENLRLCDVENRKRSNRSRHYLRMTFSSERIISFVFSEYIYIYIYINFFSHIIMYMNNQIILIQHNQCVVEDETHYRRDGHVVMKILLTIVS